MHEHRNPINILKISKVHQILASLANCSKITVLFSEQANVLFHLSKYPEGEESRGAEVNAISSNARGRLKRARSFLREDVLDSSRVIRGDATSLIQ